MGKSEPVIFQPLENSALHSALRAQDKALSVLRTILVLGFAEQTWKQMSTLSKENYVSSEFARIWW